MRYSKLLILVAALLIMLELTGAALAENTIDSLWKYNGPHVKTTSKK